VVPSEPSASGDDVRRASCVANLPRELRSMARIDIGPGGGCDPWNHLVGPGATDNLNKRTSWHASKNVLVHAHQRVA